MTARKMEGIHVEMYVQSLSPPNARQRQGEVVDTLKDFSDGGLISGYTVHVTGSRMPALPGETRTEFARFLLNRIAVFELWAEQNGRSFEDWFVRHDVEGESGPYTELTFPTMVLAIYEGDELRYVAPCETGDDVGEVVERLETLVTDAELLDTEPLRKARAQPPEQSTPIPQ